MNVRRTVVITEEQDTFIQSWADGHDMKYSAVIRAAIDLLRGNREVKAIGESLFLGPIPSDRRIEKAS